ncbi:transport sec13 [Tubulinosema ratisbonensis]|uniref:Transport sec13 n=1 Tax=Tubulinosema ratisbonensis TaxID=291195 RepID=A0A437AIS3_9MICR|nr:transport sec13 [Tubulinosema ratisbonensis]
MQAQKEIIYSMDADLSEKRLVTASSDRVVRTYKIEDTQLILDQELSGHDSPVTKAIFLNKGELICSGCYTGELFIWQLEGSSFVKKFSTKVFNGSINSISHLFLENSFKIFCACSDGKVRILTFDFKLNFKTEELNVHKFGITSISSNEKYFITGGVDNKVFLFDIKTNKEIYSFNEHTNIVRDVSIAKTNEFDLDVFASCSDDGSVVIYYFEKEVIKKQVIQINEPLSSLAWSKRGYSLSVGYGENMVKHYVPDVDGYFKEVDLERVE